MPLDQTTNAANVKTVRRPDGRVYRYHRKTGTRVLGEPGTEEFAESLRQAGECEPGPKRHDPEQVEDRQYLYDLNAFIYNAVRTARKRAAECEMDFGISPAYLREVLDQQGNICALTKLRFEFGNAKGFRVSPLRPSLDRIDSAKGYIEGNVRVVCYAVNVALGEWGETVFLKIASAAVHVAINRVLS